VPLIARIIFKVIGIVVTPPVSPKRVLRSLVRPMNTYVKEMSMNFRVRSSVS
jgi:hypothetical protein